MKMKTTDWKFDFSSLPRWDVRNSIPYVYDEFFEIPQSDTLCCIYSIAEASMLNYIGFLAILKNKEDPKLFLNITDGITFCDNFSVSTSGELIFLQANIYNGDTKELARSILIIDVCKSVFSYFPTDNFNSCYKVVEINSNVFKIEADKHQMKNDKRLRALSRKKIRINHLKWHELDELL